MKPEGLVCRMHNTYRRLDLWQHRSKIFVLNHTC